MRTARALTIGRRVYLPGVPAGGVPAGGVPAQGVYLPGGVPVHGVYLPRGVPAYVLIHLDRILDTCFWKYYLAANFICGW